MKIKSFIIGTDEAGRGPLAGPVVGAAVCMENNIISSRIDDSKKIKEGRREILCEEIKNMAIAYSFNLIDQKIIDSINILQASKLAMKKSVEDVIRKIKVKFPNNNCKFYTLIDGNKLLDSFSNQEAIVKGDSKIKIIGAASIIAKVERDKFMNIQALKYPDYGFEQHKGYPTKLHKERINKYGICEIHRLTFSGVREHL